MPNWGASMQQTFEYYLVDPGTWKNTKMLTEVTGCTINRDDSSETRGSATIDLSGSLGECYIRAYLITIQNGVREEHPLGTFMVQTPALSYDGKLQSVSADAYTPLIELKENPTPLGYSLLIGENIMDAAYRLCRDNARAPVVKTEAIDTLYYDFVSNTDDTWLTFITDLVANAKYGIDVDEMGRIIFPRQQETAALQPVWTYSDDNSSILYPEVSTNRDMYGIPNVVEVVYSKGSDFHYAKVVNDDPNSPTSTVARGRTITYRDTNPDLAGNPTEEEIQRYAEDLLLNLSSLEYTISYKHGYCPVRVGDCVRLNYKRAGLTDIKAKVISQSISCEPGCPVTEKAVFTKKLWEVI